MKIVQPGKEASLAAIFYDFLGKPTDPSVQTVEVFDSLGDKRFTVQPQKLDIGIFKITFEMPLSAKHNEVWNVNWLAIVDDSPVRTVTELLVSEETQLQAASYMYIGKTFNISAPVNVGDIVSLSFHTMNLYKRSDGTQYITIYEPKFIDKSTHEKPDDAEQAVAIAKEKELLTTKRLQNFPMDDKIHTAVMQVHYRGKSAHMDFRIKVDNYLLGPTMMIEKPDAITEDVETVERAKTIERNWERYFKLKNVPQTEIEDPRRKIQVVWKATEPVDWLTVEKIVPKGEVGATKSEYGVFSIVDKPTVFFGAQKSYYKELFISGKLIDGRWVIRLLKNPWADKPAFVFMMWKPEDQTPYVLTKRAVEKKWIPPPNISALPPIVRSVVPAKFKYWEKNNITERLAIREALVNAIAKDEVKIKSVKLQNPPDIQQPKNVPVVLQHHWWRGQFVRRGGPTEEHWDVRFLISAGEPLVHFVLNENPQSINETNGIYKPTKDHKWMDVKGIQELKPRTPENPTKNTPAFIEEIDRGKAEIYESNASFMKVKFDLKTLKGWWTFTKPEIQNLWTIKRVKEAP